MSLALSPPPCTMHHAQCRSDVLAVAVNRVATADAVIELRLPSNLVTFVVQCPITPVRQRAFAVMQKYLDVFTVGSRCAPPPSYRWSLLGSRWVPAVCSPLCQCSTLTWWLVSRAPVVWCASASGSNCWLP